MQTLRIFISSPGDVQEERQAARRVIADLQKRYGEEALLQPVFWEDLPLQADLSFQQAIDLILSAHGVDIAIFVLWSRLGSEVAGITKPDGSAYRSGTEREFDLMMAARRSSPDGARRPDILVYTRRDDETFTDALDSSKGTLQLRELIEQKSLAESFIRENFTDAQGRNLRAFHTFPKPVDFASRLRVHLIELLDEKLTVSEKSVWQGNPYRGLHSFQAEHAPVFFGRERESDELAAHLRARERDPANGCAFTCIVGASGSGKSSLVRAGLAPDLLHVPSVGPDDSNPPSWRFLALTPSELVPDLPGRVIDALATQFPSLTRNTSPRDLAEALQENPSTFLKLSLRPAIQVSAIESGSPVKCLLLIDQFEEVFTHPEFKSSTLLNDMLLPLLRVLACSGDFWVVATLRSDFYPAAQKLPVFLALRGTRNFDLLPPDGAALRRIIVRPAALAGASFEVLDAKSGFSLADQLLQDVHQQPDALPLLQFTLEALFSRRRTSGLLTRQEYNTLGGLSGAINQRAEDTLANLASSTPAPLLDACFAHVFSRLFEIDSSSGKESPVRSSVNQESLLLDSPDQVVTLALLDAFTEARLIVTREKDGRSICTVAHEALLRDWKRLIQLRERQSENLRRRARLLPAHAAWLSTPHPSLLLAEGLPLNEALQILNEAPELLNTDQRAYVDLSDGYHRRRRGRRRLWVVSTLLILASLAAAATLAFLQADHQKTIALEAKEKAIAAERASNAALLSEQENLRIYQASNYRTFEAIEKYFEGFPEGQLLGLLESFSTLLGRTYQSIPPENRTAKHQNDYASILEMQSLLMIREAKGNVLMVILKSKAIFDQSLEIRRQALDLKPDPSLCIAIAEQFHGQCGYGNEVPKEAVPIMNAVLSEKRKIILRYLDAIPVDYGFYQQQVVPLRKKIEALRLSKG